MIWESLYPILGSIRPHGRVELAATRRRLFPRCVGSLLAKFNAGTIFYPRQFRIRFPLEIALFYWAKTQRHGPPDHMALQYRRKARRAAGRTSQGKRLDCVIDRVKSGDHAAAAKVAGELQAILREFSLNSG